MKLITARQAFDSGLTRYFTGKVCKYGHLAERMISNGSCVDCLNEKRKRTREDIYEATKVWRLKNPDARRIEAQKYRKKHPEKVKANVARYIKNNIELVRKRCRDGKRKMRADNPEREKATQLRYLQKQEKLKEEAAGRPKPELCEICSTNEFRIVFDHCHVNGHFRGWICDRCNRVLGCVKDSIELLDKMSEYLENRNGSQEKEFSSEI